MLGCAAVGSKPMRRQIVGTMYNNDRDLTEKSGTTVFLCMLHVLLLLVVKPIYVGVQVFLLWGKVLCHINLGYLLVCLGN